MWNKELASIRSAVPKSNISSSYLQYNTDITRLYNLSRASISTSSNNTLLTNSEDVSNLEKALQSKGQITILDKAPVTLSYFDTQRLVHLQKHSNSSKLLIRFPYRLDPQIQELHNKLDKAVLGGSNIQSIAIHTNHKQNQDKNSNIRFVIDHIDLILYLSSQKVSSIQGFSGEPTDEALSGSMIQYLNDKHTDESSQASFTLLAGSLESGGSFSIHIDNQKSGKSHSCVHVGLSNGEVLTMTFDRESNAKNDDNENRYGSIEDVAKVLRLYRCALYSLDTAKKITIKHVSEKVIPIRAVGTADFLREGLFLPTDSNRKIAITGIFSKKTDKIKQLVDKQMLTGEPLEYIPDSEAAMSNPYSTNKWRPMYYIPSVPSKRKEKEMLDALKNGYVVLAEKPAFANADQAKEFLKNLDKDHQKRLFFGWHYVHNHVSKKVLEDVRSKKYGGVKHIRTFFSVPKLLADSRIFDPAQGGAGLDVYSYNLHYTLRLVGFKQSYEILQSKIKSAQYLDPKDEKLSKVDFTLDTKLKFGNGTTADLYATFDVDKNLYTEAEIWFEDGTKILCKEYSHPINTIRTYFDPILIFKAGGVRWEAYMTEEDKTKSQYWTTTYEGQLEFIRRQASGEGKYDVVNDDMDGLGMETNIKVHEIIDDVLVAGGFEKKKGA